MDSLETVKAEKTLFALNIGEIFKNCNTDQIPCCVFSLVWFWWDGAGAEERGFCFDFLLFLLILLVINFLYNNCLSLNLFCLAVSSFPQ